MFFNMVTTQHSPSEPVRPFSHQAVQFFLDVHLHVYITDCAGILAEHEPEPEPDQETVVGVVVDH